MSTVVIGCKLPHGIVLKGSVGQDIEINGMKTSLVAGGFGITHVQEDEAAYLFAVYEDFAPFKSNAIFTNSTAKVADLRDYAHDLSDIKTGFEGMDPDKPAPGMEPENPKQVDQAKAQAEAQPRPAAAPKTKADKAAANELAGS